MENAESAALNSDASAVSAATAPELAAKIFAAKARRRSWLASLPVEEKYRRFLKLQRMVLGDMPCGRETLSGTVAGRTRPLRQGLWLP